MIKIVANQLSADGMKFVKVVSDREVPEAFMRKFVHGPTLDYAVVKCYPTTALSLFYGEVTFPVRGVVDVKLEGMERARRLAVWRLMSQDGFTVSQVIHFLAGWFFTQTHHRPQYAFMRKLPASVESGCEVPQGDGIEDVMLFQAEWALEKCVMVGG